MAGAVFSVGESNSLWRGLWAFSFLLFTYTTMLHNTIKEWQKEKQNKSFELELVDETEEMNTHCCGGTVSVALIHAELCRICYAYTFILYTVQIRTYCP